MYNKQKKKNYKLLLNLPKAIKTAFLLLKSSEVSILSKAVFLGGISLYWILPFDLFPDIPFIGHLDDITVTYFLIQWFINSVPVNILEKFVSKSED